MLRRTIDHEREGHRRPGDPDTTYLDGQDEHAGRSGGADDLRYWACGWQKVAQHETDCPTPRARWRRSSLVDRKLQAVSPWLRPGPIWSEELAKYAILAVSAATLSASARSFVSMTKIIRGIQQVSTAC